MKDWEVKSPLRRPPSPFIQTNITRVLDPKNLNFIIFKYCVKAFSSAPARDFVKTATQEKYIESTLSVSNIKIQQVKTTLSFTLYTTAVCDRKNRSQSYKPSLQKLANVP